MLKHLIILPGNSVKNRTWGERTIPLFAHDEVVVMAKSAGSLLTFVAVKEGVLNPIKCIFFGIPFDLAVKDLFKDDWSPVSSFTIPAIAFHNEADPTADYRYTAATLAQHAPHITLITTNESDHWYGDIKTYDASILEFLAP
jgi:hypothetical protein